MGGRAARGVYKVGATPGPRPLRIAGSLLALIIDDGGLMHTAWFEPLQAKLDRNALSACSDSARALLYHRLTRHRRTTASSTLAELDLREGDTAL